MINSPLENDALQRAALSAQKAQASASGRADDWTRYLSDPRSTRSNTDQSSSNNGSGLN